MLLLTVLKLFSEVGNRAFLHAAPSAWNLLQLNLKLQKLASFREFKSMLQKLYALPSGSCLWEIFESGCLSLIYLLFDITWSSCLSAWRA